MRFRSEGAPSRGTSRCPSSCPRIASARSIEEGTDLSRRPAAPGARGGPCPGRVPGMAKRQATAALKGVLAYFRQPAPQLQTLGVRPPGGRLDDPPRGRRCPRCDYSAAAASSLSCGSDLGMHPWGRSLRRSYGTVPHGLVVLALTPLFQEQKSYAAVVCMKLMLGIGVIALPSRRRSRAQQSFARWLDGRGLGPSVG